MRLRFRRQTRSYIAFSTHPLGFFFFNDTATTEIYTLSLHDALPILIASTVRAWTLPERSSSSVAPSSASSRASRSEEHTSELQSRLHLVCRLLLEKKNFLSKR